MMRFGIYEVKNKKKYKVMCVMEKELPEKKGIL